ncbi:MAG: NAD(P)-dependent oxidoreductase [Candidatus Krumholzibacteria bacterium]|jgi:D-3-phosphoglycerate dehydrogenase|nr:NAD(P)-dependent oxidoreductase [Candidatus Krumholzibacteria bacterium]MDP6668832.1 NAD(P)-dependent oxidoreductase [Candidatus Krumholzibacteria bacterium]MDP6796905.1 NAD(P)-dependent oxidoreductase [Candidatus Krumholzibacteria bacterium]MDP7022023.1 NAD(P)-dependent oxidoreductase [Candidatus Krumholzibacteria bacterium]
MLILISDAFDASLADKLAPLGEVTDDKDRLPEAEVVLVRGKTKVTREYIDSAPNMKLVIRGGVGIDNIDSAYAAEKGITVHNTPKASGIAVAELAFALLLSVPNRLIEGHQSMKEGQWIKKELKRSELHGKTIGLAGIGNIAREVALRASAFGMKVIAYDKYVSESDAAEMKDSMEAMAKEADYISLHLPLTDETRGMISGDLIAAMKDGVTIVNTGRAACVDAEAMKSALESGKVRAYATDVWPSDPPAEDYPLLHAPNVTMTPHLGASSKENLLRIGEEVLSIVSEFKGGQS